MSDEKKHCRECNRNIDDYAEDEFLCGACENQARREDDGALQSLTNWIIGGNGL